MKYFLMTTVASYGLAWATLKAPEKTTVIQRSSVDIPACTRVQTRFKNESVIHHFNCGGKSVKVIEKITATRI